jgi:tetratricopeptide (TPR) repeat protein
MEYVLILIVLLSIVTLKPSYLGMFKAISLHNITSKSNMKTIRAVLLVSLIVSMIYFIFKPQIHGLFTKNVEGFTNEEKTSLMQEAYTLIEEGSKEMDSAKQLRCKDLEEEDKDKIKKCYEAYNEIVENKAKPKFLEAIGLYKNAIDDNADDNAFIMEINEKIANIYSNNLLDYDKAIETYEKEIDRIINNDDTTDDEVVISLHQKIATEYRNQAASLECDKENDPDSENCKTADELLEKATKHRAITIDEICKDEVFSQSKLCKVNNSPSENTSDIINQPSLTKGLDVENVTPSPVYYEPGTQIYGGLGYGPTHSDVANMNNKLTSKLEEVDTSDKRGFCAMSDNSMVNIDEKCRTLPHDVCASTDCCVLLGNEKCVQGDVHGPSKKGVYSDTTIKNRDLYYYKGKCYGNC